MTTDPLDQTPVEPGTRDAPDDWWADGVMVAWNDVDESAFIGDAASFDDAQRFVLARNADIAVARREVREGLDWAERDVLRGTESPAEWGVPRDYANGYIAGVRALAAALRVQP